MLSSFKGSILWVIEFLSHNSNRQSLTWQSLMIIVRSFGGKYSTSRAEMEKAYKIAHTNLWVWKISTQNMCKKRSKPCKICKKYQKLKKRKEGKTFNKTRGKKQHNLAEPWKIGTRGAATAAIFFHLWSR